MKALRLQDKFGLDMVCEHDQFRSQCQICNKPVPKKKIILQNPKFEIHKDNDNPKPRSLECAISETAKLSDTAFHNSAYAIPTRPAPVTAQSRVGMAAVQSMHGLSQGPAGMANGPAAPSFGGAGLSGGMGGGAGGGMGGGGAGGPS